MPYLQTRFLIRIFPPFTAVRVFLCLVLTVMFGTGSSFAATWETLGDVPPPVPKVAESPAGMGTNGVDRSQMLYIREFRVLGNHQLSRSEVEKAVYPYMGPERTPEDVEQARAALEKVFQEKGFQTVNVQVPQQTGKRGIVFLQVAEVKVGRLNIEGSRYYTINSIKKQVPSLQPGSVPDFNKVSKEILALNQWSDRQVIPTLTPGFEPGTVDVNLKVKDTLPWHGSAEWNNRYSAGTPKYRINIASSYDNLWQLGHSIGGSYQTAPGYPTDVQNWNVFYTARFPKIDWLRLNLSYGEQNSVSTLPSSSFTSDGNSLGNGGTAAFRFLAALPGEKDFSQSFSAGMDFKHLNQNSSFTLNEGGLNINNQQPLDYMPIRLDYNGVWAPTNSVTLLYAGVSFGFRGAMVSLNGKGYGNETQIEESGDGGFIHFNGSLSHTHDLDSGFQVFGRVQGQYSPDQLIYSEQYSGGGLDTCRGYLESTVVGNSGVFGSMELRSPSLLKGHAGINEWRFYSFLDLGTVTNVTEDDPHASSFKLASYGLGSRIKMYSYLNGSIDVGVPMTSQPSGQTYTVMAWSPLVTFRIFGEF